MNCHQAKQYMIFHAEGSLSLGLATDLNSHLAVCRNCSHVYNEIRLTLDTSEKSKQVRVDPWFAGRVEQQFLNLSSQTLKKNQRLETVIRYIRIIPVAASLAIALWVGILIGSELSLKFTGQSDAEDLTSNLYEDLVAEDLYDGSLETFFLNNGDK